MQAADESTWHEEAVSFLATADGEFFRVSPPAFGRDGTYLVGPLRYYPLQAVFTFDVWAELDGRERVFVARLRRLRADDGIQGTCGFTIEESGNYDAVADAARLCRDELVSDVVRLAALFACDARRAAAVKHADVMARLGPMSPRPLARPTVAPAAIPTVAAP